MHIYICKFYSDHENVYLLILSHYYVYHIKNMYFSSYNTAMRLVIDSFENNNK